MFATPGGRVGRKRLSALANSGVTPGLYGSATQVPQVTVDAKGRITLAANVGISGAGGGSLVLLEQHTASASASLDFTTWYSSTYDDYLIEVLNILPATNAANAWLQVSTNGGSSYDTSGIYQTAAFRWSKTGTAVAGSASSTAFLLTTAGMLNTATDGGLTGTLWLTNPGNGTMWTLFRGEVGWMEQVAPEIVGGKSVGAYKSTTAVNAFRLIMSSGNITSGLARVYGIAKT